MRPSARSAVLSKPVLALHVAALTVGAAAAVVLAVALQPDGGPSGPFLALRALPLIAVLVMEPIVVARAFVGRSTVVPLLIVLATACGLALVGPTRLDLATAVPWFLR